MTFSRPWFHSGITHVVWWNSTDISDKHALHPHGCNVIRVTDQQGESSLQYFRYIPQDAAVPLFINVITRQLLRSHVLLVRWLRYGMFPVRCLYTSGERKRRNWPEEKDLRARRKEQNEEIYILIRSETQLAWLSREGQKGRGNVYAWRIWQIQSQPENLRYTQTP
jgi:hypothetical protein